MQIASKLWHSLPRPWRDGLWSFVRAPLNLLMHYARDARRFLRFNTFGVLGGDKHLEYNILMLSHMLEKGLALRDTRPFFGADVVDLLVSKTRRIHKSEEASTFVVSTALNALSSYVAFNEKLPGKTHRFETQSAEIADILKRSCLSSPETHCVATIAAPPPQFTEEQQALMEDLIKTRHSIRHFSKRPVSESIVLRAVEIAQRSPSSCNLQPTRILVVRDKQTIIAALDIQQGARGFKDEVSMLLVLTYEIGLQIGPRSRHQGYTDSGIFAGTLMLALHAFNVASCPLNWAMERRNDRQLRALLRLPDSQNVVMLIACGHAESEAKAAMSARRPLPEVCQFWRGP
jgi:nitroreductase